MVQKKDLHVQELVQELVDIVETHSQASSSGVSSGSKACSGKQKKKATSSKRTKRRPGRPSNKPPAPSLEKNGIVDSPSDLENRLEFVYGNPLMFKSLFTYFKNLKAQNIHIRCTPSDITFFALDHSTTCRVVAKIPGESMNHFYCDDTFWFCLNRETVEKVFSTIDKSFYKITLLVRHDDATHFVVILKDAEIDKDCNYKIRTSSVETDKDLIAAESLTTSKALSMYPVTFVLTAKQFKKSVTDASYYSKKLTIEKLGSYPLQLTYTRLEVVYHEVYRSPTKIHLESSVDDQEMFRCTLKIPNIKSLASSMVTKTVRIYCHEEKDIVFRSKIEDLDMCTLAQLA